jgi:hypothetical protein
MRSVVRNSWRCIDFGFSTPSTTRSDRLGGIAKAADVERDGASHRSHKSRTHEKSRSDDSQVDGRPAGHREDDKASSGLPRRHRCRGLCLILPHVIQKPISIDTARLKRHRRRQYDQKSRSCGPGSIPLWTGGSVLITQRRVKLSVNDRCD